MIKIKKVHETAEVSKEAEIGDGTFIWNHAQVREGAKIGENCVVSKNVYIDHHVKIGNKVKIQNNVSIFYNAEIEDGVFIAPHVCFSNDKIPRAINPNGTLKSGGTIGSDWKILKTVVKEGASIGANATILPGVNIGKFAMVGSGSVVTKNVPDFALVYGNPAKMQGYVCKCGEKLSEEHKICDVCKINLKDIKNDTNS